MSDLQLFLLRFLQEGPIRRVGRRETFGASSRPPTSGLAR
jgi:transcriptional regulator of aromatic amino acid metabolism